MEKFRAWLKQHYENVAKDYPQAAIYIYAIFLVGLGLLIGKVLGKIGALMSLAGIILMSAVFLTETYRTFVSLLDLPIFKFLFSALAAALAALSVGLTAQQTAIVTGADPAYFRNSIAVASIFNFPIFLLFSIALLSIVLPVIQFVWIPLKLIGRELLRAELNSPIPLFSNFWKVETSRLSSFRMDLFLVFSRVMAAAALFTVSKHFLLPLLPQYEGFYRSSLSRIIYEIDMYTKTTCDMKVGEKAAYISSDLILTGKRATNGAPIYSIRECKGTKAIREN